MIQERDSVAYLAVLHKSSPQSLSKAELSQLEKASATRPLAPNSSLPTAEFIFSEKCFVNVKALIIQEMSR